MATDLNGILTQIELRARAVKRLTGANGSHDSGLKAPPAFLVLHDLASSPATAAAAIALLHELQVHQVEVDMQAEELRRSGAELESTLNRQVQLYDFAPIGYVMFKRTKRMNKFEEGLPEALDLICSALRVGHSLNSALGLVTRECPDPVGTEFRVCFDEQNYGLELKTALENMTNRVPVQDLRIVVTGILIQKESGGNLAEVLEKASEVIRERFRLKRQVMTHTAQGRLTGLILTLLPIFLGCALYFVNPEMTSLLWTREIGIKLLYAAGGMIVVGGLIIRKIVNMDV